MLIALVPLVFVILAIGSFIIYQSNENVKSQLDERGKTIVQQAALMSEFYLYTGNTEKLSEVADVIIKIDELEFIRFLDSMGNILVQRGSQTSNATLEPYYTVVKSPTLELDDFSETVDEQLKSEVLGSILIGISRNNASAKQQQGYYLVLLVSVVSLLIGVVLIYFFSKKFNLAMQSLLNSAKAIQKSQYNHYCLENGTGELYLFQKTFNEMIDTLRVNEKELQSKIMHATQSLSESVQELESKNIELENTKKEAVELERSKAITDERSRIMRDMHDGIGGQLVASLALMELEEDSEANRHIRSILAECLDDFRLIINSLNAQENTLSAVLANFKYRINKKLKKLNISLVWDSLDLADDYIVEPQQSLHILRIIQEAFTNILKHADASEITFSVTSSEGVIKIEVSDNGHALPIPDEQLNLGHGIKNMQWRTQELGGTLSLNKSSHGGYKLCLMLPVE